MAGLKLTPEILRATYAFLDETEPFCMWGLPDADEVKFIVSKDRTLSGWARWPEREIGISSAAVGCTRVLVEVMAHEMVHFAVDQTKVERSEHGQLFCAYAAKVCRAHGFDYKSFV